MHIIPKEHGNPQSLWQKLFLALLHGMESFYGKIGSQWLHVATAVII